MTTPVPHAAPTPDGLPTTDGGVARRTFLAAGGAAVATGTLGLGAAAVTGHLPGVDPLLTPAAPTAADKDSLALLKKMLAFDTQNFGEGGQTREHAEWLRSVWRRAGVPAKIIPTPQPDNVHLIARIEGTTSAAPLLLLGHSDVVPVERENWDVDPFGAVVRQGRIYGRGALDMKGANAASIAALLRHVGEGHRFERDIIVLTDCDEEAGSYGSGWLAENHWSELDAGMVLTEGGWMLAQSDGTTPMLITVTRQDKVYFNLDLYARGTATHSSKPMPDSAIVGLSRAVAAVGDWKAPVALTEVTRAYYSALARATDDGYWAKSIRLMLAARDRSQLERAAALVVKGSDYPYLHSALLRTTMSFVIEDAGYKENVIPSEAHVRVNCRGVPGGQKPRDFLAALRRELDGRDVEVVLAAPEGTSESAYLDQLDETWATPPADLGTPLYRAIEQASVRTYPGAVFSPALFEAGTSLGPWRERGIPGYGVYPYVIDNSQLVAMHGNNENIGTAALARGTDFMYRVFDRFRG